MPADMTRRSFAWVASFLMCTFALPACSDDSPTLVVDVVSGIVPVAQFARAHVDLLADDGVGGFRTLAYRDSYATRSDDYAHGYRVAEFEGIASGEYTVQVRLLLADARQLIQRRTRVRIAGNFCASRAHHTQLHQCDVSVAGRQRWLLRMPRWPLRGSALQSSVHGLLRRRGILRNNRGLPRNVGLRRSDMHRFNLRRGAA